MLVISVAFALLQGEGGAQAITQGVINGAENAVVFAFGLIGDPGFLVRDPQSGRGRRGHHLLGPAPLPARPPALSLDSPDDPANASILMAITVNLLGLGNAATPLGLKAMQELARLNRRKTWPPTPCAPSSPSRRRASRYPRDRDRRSGRGRLGATGRRRGHHADRHRGRAPRRRSWPTGPLTDGRRPAIMELFHRFPPGRSRPFSCRATGRDGAGRAGYEVFCEGAKEGLEIAVRILPYLIAMFVALGVFRASSALDAVLGLVPPVAKLLGIPAEVVPLALISPPVGLGVPGDLGRTSRSARPRLARRPDRLHDAGKHRDDLLRPHRLFGSVGVVKARHSVAVGLLADFVSFAASVLAVSVARWDRGFPVNAPATDGWAPAAETTIRAGDSRVTHRCGSRNAGASRPAVGPSVRLPKEGVACGPETRRPSRTRTFVAQFPPNPYLERLVAKAWRWALPSNRARCGSSGCIIPDGGPSSSGSPISRRSRSPTSSSS